MKCVVKHGWLIAGLLFAVFLCPLGVSAEVKYWTGSGNDDATLASAADNWDPAGTPTADDDVVVGPKSGSRPMTWDLNNGVKSWTQTADYTGTISFKTGRSGVASKVNVLAYGEAVAGSDDLWLKIAGDVVISNGVWTHPVQPVFSNTDLACTNGLGIWRMLIKVGGKMEIASSAKIDVSSNGFLAVTGPGRGSGTAGASHGGRGATYNSSYGSLYCSRDCYGSVKKPVCLGSGGCYSSGGGAVRLAVAGALTLDGQIRADANDYNYGKSTVQTYYAPAGGSVFVEAGSISGSGYIAANGGYCTSGGCGGGGRVAVKLTGTGSTFAGFPVDHISAIAKLSNSMPAFAGTVYLETLADEGDGELRVRGCNATFSQIENARKFFPSTQLMDKDDDYSFSRILLENAAVLGIESNVVVKTREILSVNATANTNQVAFKGGQLNLGQAATVSNLICRIQSPCEPFAYEAGGTKATTFGSGSLVYVDAPLSFPGDVTLARGARMITTINGASFTYRLKLDITGDFTVEEGAIVDAIGTGYNANKGHGDDNLGLGPVNGVGGSHGGLSRGPSTAVCYGSVTNPDEPGAGCRSTGGVPMRGGGVIRLEAKGALKVDGRIAADGESGQWIGGAGGSVYIKVASVSGKGSVSAHGGSQRMGGAWYGGGGGRVAVYLSSAAAEFTAAPVIAAYGGTAGGSAGTVYLETASDGVGRGRVVIDNNNQSAPVSYTSFGEHVTDDLLHTVVITNGAKVWLASGHTLDVDGDWLNSSVFTSDVGGTVRFVGSDVSRIVGVNDFANLTCTVPGKTLRFGTGTSRLNVIADGCLTLEGDASGVLRLERDGDEGMWPLALDKTATMSLKYLNVTDSDASYGATEAFATDSSGENNVNWTIVGGIEPGETIGWTGAVDDSWTTKDNWNLGRLPVATDRVVIGPSANPPRLAGDTDLGRLWVSNGATLYVAGFGLTVTDGVTCAGTLAFAGTDRLSFACDVNLSGATFSGKAASLAITADGSQTANLGGLICSQCDISGEGALTVGSGFTSDDLGIATLSPLRLSLAPGVVIETGSLAVDGGASQALSLWGESGSWQLKVSRYATAVGVSVSNCVVSGVHEIVADAPSADCGGNVGWRFATSGVATWVGGSSGSFEDPSNWSAPPGADSRVAIPAGVTVTASSPVVLRSLTLAGSLVCSAGLSASDTVVVEDGGTLTLDRPSSVGGHVLLLSGAVLTHSANFSAETYRLELTVGGDMTVEQGASVDVIAKGYSNYNFGPGGGVGSTCGAGHGGRGGLYVDTSESRVPSCYGSVFTPTNIGSSAYHHMTSAGGGSVHLIVGGKLLLDGLISADGSHQRVEYYSGSGGSVWLQAASVVGAGTVSANGGYYYNTGAGAGGRIALYQTEANDFSGFTGKLFAHGGHYADVNGNTSTPQAAAGTIYRQSAGEAPRTGTITIDAGNANIAWYNQWTELPVVGVGGDDKRSYSYASVVLSQKAVLGLTGDLTVGDLDLPSGTEVRLFGHRLRIRSTRRRGTWEGTVTPGDGGRVIWGIPGMQIILR